MMLHMKRTISIAILASFLPACDSFSYTTSLFKRIPAGSTVSWGNSYLHMSLKPMAVPLMDAGKAFARSGELLIDSTNAFGIYGGALSAVGANLRNSGDCIAQAAASCRFKTGYELVTDEFREAATCLDEAVGKLNLAVEEANVVDKQMAEGRTGLSENFGSLIEKLIEPMASAHTSLESVGVGIMQRVSTNEIGDKIIQTSVAFEQLSESLLLVAKEGQVIGGNRKVEPTLELCAQRLYFASMKMREAGEKLTADPPSGKIKGKGWLKGGYIG